MITPDDPMLVIWRADPANSQLTDANLCEAITTAYARVDAIAKRAMTQGARDLAAGYIVRIKGGHHDEKDTLREIVELLTGGAL